MNDVDRDWHTSVKSVSFGHKSGPPASDVVAEFIERRTFEDYIARLENVDIPGALVGGGLPLNRASRHWRILRPGKAKRWGRR